MLLLNRTNAMLSKVRHFVDKKTLKSIYHAIFESHCIPVLFGHRILIPLKDFIFCKRNL